MSDLTPETLAELQRRHAALTPFALSFLTGGPGGDPFIALAAEDGSPLSDAGFDAVLLFAEMASDSLPALLDAATELAHMREARDNASAEVDRLTATVERVRKLADRIDRQTEVETDEAMFRDADTGGWWEVSDAIRAALDEEADRD